MKSLLAFVLTFLAMIGPIVIAIKLCEWGEVNIPTAVCWGVVASMVIDILRQILRELGLYAMDTGKPREIAKKRRPF